MFYLDGSEISWLVYADWLEDQDISANHIRDTINLNYDFWYFQENPRIMETNEPWDINYRVGSAYDWDHSVANAGSCIMLGAEVGTDRDVCRVGSYPLVDHPYHYDRIPY